MEKGGTGPKVHRPNGPGGWAEITREADAIWSAGGSPATPIPAAGNPPAIPVSATTEVSS
jgi:hypothetical protein